MELWRSDGTRIGTERVADIAQGPTNSNPNWLMVLPGKLVFSALEPTVGTELWALPLA